MSTSPEEKQGPQQPASPKSQVLEDLRNPKVDGRSSRWDAHRAQRKLELLRLAREAIHEYGPDISMDDMANFVGTSKSIMYRYFSDKDTLRAEISAYSLSVSRKALRQAISTSSDPRTRLDTMMYSYITMVKNSPNIYTFLRQAEANDSHAHFTQQAANLISEIMFEVFKSRGLPGAMVDMWASAMIGMADNATDWWYMHREDPENPVDTGDMDELQQTITTWMWNSIPGTPTSS